MVDSSFHNLATGIGKTVPAATRNKTGNDERHAGNFSEFVSAAANRRPQPDERNVGERKTDNDNETELAATGQPAPDNDVQPVANTARLEDLLVLTSVTDNAEPAGGEPRSEPELKLAGGNGVATPLTQQIDDRATCNIKHAAAQPLPTQPVMEDKAALKKAAGHQSERSGVKPGASAVGQDLIAAPGEAGISDDLGPILAMLKVERQARAINKDKNVDAAPEGQSDAIQDLQTGTGQPAIGHVLQLEADQSSRRAEAHAKSGEHPDREGRPAAAAEQTFRFRRSDGKAGTMDLLPAARANGQDHRLGDRFAAAVENIAVLESRSYPGLAPGNNAGLLGHAIGDDLQTIFQSSTSDGPAGNVSTVVHTLKLQMHPDNLGPMTASLRLKGGELSINVIVESSDAYKQMSADQEGLIKALRAQGFAVDQVTIQLAAVDRSSEMAGQNSNGSQQGQTARDGNSERTPGQGMQNGQSSAGGSDNPQGHTKRQSNGNQGGWQSNDTIIDPAAGSRSDLPRPSQLFL